MKLGIRLLIALNLFTGLQQTFAQVSFAPATNYNAGNYSHGSIFDSVTAADVNGDGKVDLISANNVNNTITVLTNNGKGVFGSNATYLVGDPGSVIAADVNGDGKPDLIVVNLG
jgi:hypothetical protein